MAKVADPEYFLAVIEAMEAGRVLSSGRTKPMIIRGVCHSTGYKGDYVVKCKVLNRFFLAGVADQQQVILQRLFGLAASPGLNYCPSLGAIVGFSAWAKGLSHYQV